MAHNVTLAADTANELVDAVAALCDGGSIQIYDGAQPADPDEAVTTQTLLATCTFGSPAFAAAVAGVATAHPITADPSADTSGAAAWFRILTAGSDPVLDGTVGVGVNFDCNVVSTAVVAGVAFPVDAMTIGS